MGNESFTSKVLIALNVVYTVFGLGITATALWFLIEVYTLTNLRNTNHYKLDYKVYWAQATPWLFIFPGVVVLITSGCGFISARKKNRALVIAYIATQAFAIVMLLISAIVALVCADSVASDKFINDAIWDAFHNMKDEPGVENAFGMIERNLHCCGVTGSRDYRGTRKDIPMSCCDDIIINPELQTGAAFCSFSDKQPNDRMGCSKVATHHARIVIRVLSAVAIIMAFIGALTLTVSSYYSKSLNDSPKVTVARYEAENEQETPPIQEHLVELLPIARNE